MLQRHRKNYIETEVVIDKDIMGVLRSPDFLFSATPYKDQLSPPTPKVVVILPGEDEDYNSRRIRT